MRILNRDRQIGVTVHGRSVPLAVGNMIRAQWNNQQIGRTGPGDGNTGRRQTPGRRNNDTRRPNR